MTHFNAHISRKTSAFILCVSMEMMVFSIVTSYIAHEFILKKVDTQLFQEGFSFLEYWVIAIFFAPVFETFFLQLIPILALKRMGIDLRFQFVVSCLLFILVHFSYGLAHGISGGVVGGAYLAFSFLVYANNSTLKAFFVTTSIHTIANVSMFFLSVIL